MDDADTPSRNEHATRLAGQGDLLLDVEDVKKHHEVDTRDGLLRKPTHTGPHDARRPPRPAARP